MKTIESKTIITPAIICGDITTNVKVQADDKDFSIYTIHYSTDDHYILQSKDGSMPDIAINNETVNLIIEAKRVHDAALRINTYFTTSDEYGNDIINNKKVMNIMLRAYLEQTIENPDIASIARSCIDTQQYRK